MRESDFIRLGIEAARIEARGGDCAQVLADGLHRIMDVEVAIGRWSLSAPHSGRTVVAGVPTISATEYGDLVRYSPRHPLLRRERMASPRPFRLSDEIALTEFWNTDVWWHTHGIRGGRYPAGFSLGIHHGQAGMVGLHRSERDFGNDELAYLDLLREPLQSALRFRAEFDRAIARLDEVETPDNPEERQLTSREREVLALVTTGRTNAMIGSILGITERTVRKHLTNTYAKLDVSGRTAAAMWYREASGAAASPIGHPDLPQSGPQSLE